MESRLAELELKLGGESLTSSGQLSSSKADVSSRLDKLMRLAASATAPPTNNPSSSSTDAKAKANLKRLALHEEFRTIDRLLSELAMSPMAGPTEASAGSGNANHAPMVFRRMEILASSESMKRDMDLLARIRELTVIGTKPSAAGETTVGNSDDAGSSSRVVNCPIVTSERYNLPSDPDAAERLERLCFRVARVNQRTAVASQRADKMLNSYGNIMMALSEKMVLAEEQIVR
mmetsp:Transcript_10692/g.23669  ORF Transcript_10692/g.23669 Transcript_10692/m.23669 type:complete len:233 (+) Transcript_10692:72-770(+)|eukprot:CAMPEP_0172314402 /NCGR_PEP_ID=MMETSP1058-20130122/22442_1 /TAXON_ID=83371 /ORGANISM="Detonula confervacea, Strain CCMP 353" /LENGTH=232 /DNA_ID=CAMNT_0013028261 /DNA_START=19 /DNA_END=717 /DNA_ORIENTATION=-